MKKRGAQRGVAGKIQPCVVDVAEDRIWFIRREHKFDYALPRHLALRRFLSCYVYRIIVRERLVLCLSLLLSRFHFYAQWRERGKMKFVRLTLWIACARMRISKTRLKNRAPVRALDSIYSLYYDVLFKYFTITFYELFYYLNNYSEQKLVRCSLFVVPDNILVFSVIW